MSTLIKKNMNMKDYSDKSFVLYGEDTKKYKEEIKKLGGKFNSNLKEIGAGWIFSVKNKEKVEEFLNIFSETKSNEVENSHVDIELKPYSEKSFLITGDDTKKYKEKLKELGGKWNSTLKGWIYSIKNEEKVKEWMSSIIVNEEEYYYSADEEI